MSKHTPRPEALRLADALEKDCWHITGTDAGNASDELRRLYESNMELLTILQELQESAAYWSEYDVPLGIVDRINAAIAKAKGEV